MNAFMNFSNANRQQVMDENPGLPITEIAKLLGSMWRALSDADKKSWK